MGKYYSKKIVISEDLKNKQVNVVLNSDNTYNGFTVLEVDNNGQSITLEPMPGNKSDVTDLDYDEILHIEVLNVEETICF